MKLAELLVCMAILLILGACAYSGYSTAMRAANRSMHRIEKSAAVISEVMNGD